MPKGLKNFEVKKEAEPCYVCGKRLQELSSISYRTWDPTRRYVGSGRPMVGTYKIKCCPKCFQELMAAIDGAIDQVCESKT